MVDEMLDRFGAVKNVAVRQIGNQMQQLGCGDNEFLTLAIVALTRTLGTDGNRVDVGCRHVVAPTDVNAPRPPVARSLSVAKVIRPA